MKAQLPSLSSIPNIGIPALDGLRGIAAIWVLMAHALILSGSPSLPILSWGDVAVDLFMALSGFLMMHGLLLKPPNRIEKRKFWFAFWTRRFFRIAPTYYLALLISSVFTQRLGEMRAGLNSIWPSVGENPERYLSFNLETIITHVTFVFGAIPEQSFNTPLPDWSIGLEMQFYIAFPILAIAFIAGRPLLGGMIALIAGLSFNLALPEFVSSFHMPSLLSMKIQFFVAGMWIAYGRKTQKSITFLFASLICIAITADSARSLVGSCAVIAILSMSTANTNLIPPLSSPQIQFLLKGMQRFLSGRLAAFFGKISYSLYLGHLLLMLPIASYLALRPSYISSDWFIRFSYLCGLTLILATPACFYIYRKWELKGSAFGKRASNVILNRQHIFLFNRNTKG